ncbi:M15 family peptidase [Nocardioides marmorisolisilvae]|uniref:M15 family peptidase n=1 Tax=Nocardioides marmorisolisilvae TaxID=1542737 RepID=A0A3N0DIM8_9ACTN|nr:M15 family peptidase [Nocardioides marmorisolisilvae]
MGTRPLPRTSSGFGLQKPTPPELRNRRFTLPDRLPMLPGTGFAARITDPAPRSVIRRSTWQHGCPVRAGDLAWIRLTFRGFDGHRHTGELLVNGAVARDLVRVFHQLWDHRFPIEQMVITGRSQRHARPTGDGNDTAAFNCRPVRGATVLSQHAYGLAVDVNPFQNPYEKGSLVLPELAGAYTNRSWRRPGMILPGGVVVRAFRSIGWTWGGTWHSLKDLQHFSENGG